MALLKYTKFVEILGLLGTSSLTLSRFCTCFVRIIEMSLFNVQILALCLSLALLLGVARGGSRVSSTADREEPPEPTTLRIRPDGSDPWERLRRFVNISYLQCIYNTARQYKVGPRHPAYFADVNMMPTHEPIAAPPQSLATTSPQTSSIPSSESESSFRSRNGRNPCGYQIIPEDSLFSGIDSLFLVGDSTIMRSYMHATHASDEDYIAKVASLEDDLLNTSIPLSSGRRMPIYFVRMLHVSTAAVALERVFDAATRNSLIVVTIGSHDCSWLTFRRPMPGFRKSFTGNWFQAKKYWRRFVPLMVSYIAIRLQRFEDSAPVSAIFKKPVVVFREQYLPNCQHPKYSKYPLITKCPDLLKPIVIPYYRIFLRSMLATINVPTISNDALFPPCFLVDAGHTARFCKRFEMQMFVQAFRETRRLLLDQGYPKITLPRTYPFHVIVDSHVLWRDLAILVAEVPTGYRGSKGDFPHRGQIDPETAAIWLNSAGGSDMRQMLRLFENPQLVERQLYIPWNDSVEREGPTVGGRFGIPVNYSQPAVFSPYLAPVIPKEVFDPMVLFDQFVQTLVPASLVAGGDGQSKARLPPFRLWNYFDVNTLCLFVGLAFTGAAGYMITRS